VFNLLKLKNICLIELLHLVLTDGTGYLIQMGASRLAQPIQLFITKRQTPSLCLVVII
jgi:hypothetical protein